MKEAIEQLQDIMKKRRIIALLITDMTNIRYLTGFTGSSAFCILTRDKKYFFTDFRYIEQAEHEVNGWTLEIEKGKRINTIKKHLTNHSINNIAFESTISYLLYSSLKRLNITLKPVAGLIEDIRQIKTYEEINNIKEAYRRAENAYLEIKRFVKKGTKESHIALKLENSLKHQGCQRIPFEIIVASGHNSSKPHATVTEKKIQKGDFVTIDWGGEYKGYHSDITRTLLIKDSNLDEKCRIYNIVDEARAKAIDSILVKKKAKDIDRIARSHITNNGYGEYFGHGLGHGIGLQAHEEPRINKISKSVIANGMVFTVEPGIYIRNFGGVRIEDTVLIYNDKVEVINKLPTKLEIL